MESGVQLTSAMPYMLGVSMLSKFAKSGHVPHALLFTGVHREENRKIAYEFAKWLVHNKTNGDFSLFMERECACASCGEIAAGTHPDFICVDDASPSIQQIRHIKKRVALSTFSASKKIIVIVYADTMKKEAANALLKVLEEPRGETLFILIGRSYSSFYPTISSRAIEIRFADRATRDAYVTELGKRHAKALELIEAPALHVRFRKARSYNLKNKDELLELLDAWLLKVRGNLSADDTPRALRSLKQILAAKALLQTGNANPQLILEQLLIAN